MLLDMHWMDEVRATPVPAPPPQPRRVRRPRACRGLRPALAALAPTVGTWAAEMDYHHGGWTGQDLRARGTTVVRIAQAGAALSIESELQGWMGRTVDHAVVLEEPSAGGRFVLYVVDSFTAGCQRYDGRLEDQTLLFEHAATLDGKPGVVQRRLRFTDQAQSWTVSFWSRGVSTGLVTGRLRRMRHPLA